MTFIASKKNVKFIKLGSILQKAIHVVVHLHCPRYTCGCLISPAIKEHEMKYKRPSEDATNYRAAKLQIASHIHYQSSGISHTGRNHKDHL